MSTCKIFGSPPPSSSWAMCVNWFNNKILICKFSPSRFSHLHLYYRL